MTRNVYLIDPYSGTASKPSAIPEPVAHAPLAALGTAFCLVGGVGSTTRNAIDGGRR